MKITKAQKDALEVIRGMIDMSNTNVPDYGTKILALIFGILDVDYTHDDQITDLDNDKNKPTPPFIPGDYQPLDYQPPQVWYKPEPEPIKTDASEDVRYVTEVTHTGDKNCIVYTTNTADIQYNGDFRDEQTSFNDK